MDLRDTAPLGAQGAPAQMNVTHACGHVWRWHFFAPNYGTALANAGLAAVLNCPRCDGTQLGAGDVSYWPTGVCHAHDGACPETPWDSWLDGLGIRFRPGELTIIGG